MRFLRKFRQKLLAENKLKRYLLYAVGEIFLVVVGILIAVQINNWNELRKKDRQRVVYETSLISELENDLAHLDYLDSLSSAKRTRIRAYFDYYDSENPDLGILHRKSDSIISSKVAFYSSAYSIEDLITTGNLSLFSKAKKAAILKLKNTHDRYVFYETQSIQDVGLYEQEIKKNFDMVNFIGLSGKEHPDSRLWKQNLNSTQFRIYNNSLVENLKLFEFQSEMYQIINEATVELLEELKEE